MGVYNLERAKKALTKDCICDDCEDYNLFEDAIKEIEKLREIIRIERFARHYPFDKCVMKNDERWKEIDDELRRAGIL